MYSPPVSRHVAGWSYRGRKGVRFALNSWKQLSYSKEKREQSTAQYIKDYKVFAAF